MLLNYLRNENLYCMNTFFEKAPQRKWTWKSPNNLVKNEIDYVLTSGRKICNDVTVLNRFDTGSNHRLVRATIVINTRLERRKLIRKTGYPTIEELSQKVDEYQTIIRRKLHPAESLTELGLDDLCSRITKSIQVATKSVCAWSQRKGPSKIGYSTMRLIEERRRTNRDSYVDLNKRIKKEIRKDLRTFNT